MFAKDGLRISKFLVAGALASAVNLVALYVATELFGMWYLLSSFFAYTISFFVNFMLQGQWVFEGHGNARTNLKFILFLFNAVFDVGANLVLLHIFVETLLIHYIFSQALIIGLLSFKNFFLYKKCIFKDTVK